MAETSLNTFTRSGTIKPTTEYINQGGQTCLERFGMVARGEHLSRNFWYRDEQYTKQLVDSEYDVQTEFRVSSLEDRLYQLAEYEAQKKVDEYNREMLKQANKEEKRESKKKKKEKLETTIEFMNNDIVGSNR